MPDEVSLLDLGSGEEDLAEFAAARHLLDAPDLDARLLHVDEEEPDPAMWLGGRIRAREQKALVGVVSAAGPCLLAAEDPLPIAALGSRAQSGEVAPGVWLAKALAEDELAAEDPLDVGLFLPVAPQRHERGREQGHPETAEDAGGSGRGHLLLVDRLHHRRGAAPSRLFGPAELQPAALVQAPLPLALDLGLLFLPVAAGGTVPPLGGQVALEPASDLVPEGFLCWSESQIHG